MEEIGTLRSLVTQYQTLYANAANLVESAPHFHLSQLSSQHFLIFANGRTGSTWLESSLNQLPDVRAYSEIRWKVGPKVHEQHVHAGRGCSMKERIEEACNSKEPPESQFRVSGTKLALDPYYYRAPSLFDDLKGVIEPDIKLILLKRSYLETFLSWKIRGVAHAVDEDVAARQRRPDAVTIRVHAEPSRLHLTLDGQPMAGDGGAPYPLKTAIDDLLVFFANDLGFRSIVEQRGGLFLDYAEIPTRFSEIARFVGSEAGSNDITSAIARPLTLKLPTLEKFLDPVAPLAQIADVLDRAFLAPHPDILKWHEEGSLRLRVPGLSDTLASIGVRPLCEAKDVIWWPRKPFVVM
jgi:hypothetical protein